MFVGFNLDRYTVQVVTGCLYSKAAREYKVVEVSYIIKSLLNQCYNHCVCIHILAISSSCH